MRASKKASLRVRPQTEEQAGHNNLEKETVVGRGPHCSIHSLSFSVLCPELNYYFVHKITFSFASNLEKSGREEAGGEHAIGTVCGCINYEMILIVVGLISVAGPVFPIIQDRGTEVIYAVMGIKWLLCFLTLEAIEDSNCKWAEVLQEEDNMSERSQIANLAELEALSLDMPSQCDELASRKMRLEKLMRVVQEMAKQSVAQMSLSLEAIHDRIETLRKLPSSLKSQVDGGTCSRLRTGEEAANLARACIDGECRAIDAELGKLRKVEEQLNKTVALVIEALPSTVNEVLAQVPSHVVPGLLTARPMEPAITYTLSDDGVRRNMECQAGSDSIADVHGEFQWGKIGSQVLTRMMSNSSPSTSSLSQCGSQLDIGHMFAAMALLEVEMFSDPHGRGFSEFVMRFSMKYGNLGLRDHMLVHLLFSKLDGYPKAVAEALPKHVREGSFEHIIEALSSKFKENESATQMKAYMELKHLRMTKDVTREGSFEHIIEALSSKFKENESATQMKAYMELKHLRMTKDVTRYCLELESPTRRAYPDASEENSQERESWSQLTEWPEYLQLFTTMELAPEHSAYEMVKAMAQRCERSKEIAASMREASGEEAQHHPYLEGRETHVVGRREEDSQPLETTSLSSISCRSKVQQQSSFKNKIKCYNCNKLGHLRRYCRNRKVAEKTAEKDEHSQGSSGRAKMFTASLSKWICGSVGKVKGHDELVGRQTVTNVRLLGLTRKALLDTGSQISIIPLDMFQARLASGFGLDADVEEIPINQRNQVYDASGNKMSFEGAVRLTLQLGNGVKRRIALFVMAGGDGMVVLGTNALAKLGIGPTSTSGVLMTAEKVVNEAAGKTSATVKPTQRRRRRKQQSNVAKAPNSISLAGARLIRIVWFGMAVSGVINKSEACMLLCTVCNIFVLGFTIYHNFSWAGFDTFSNVYDFIVPAMLVEGFLFTLQDNLRSAYADS
ncbi:hypothetical protein Y032_0796g2397 [Ancylostoma ceylanicum]|uniref:CCHC-type domain-containing protein n=1 Tax=Ancylostoma ceylanicum TaxID=53326 RepID=A0A016WCP3_9BILA|nr:hypothetical protein Y032_0796g2397 [Ancylostoma ceylanicum]